LSIRRCLWDLLNTTPGKRRVIYDPDLDEEDRNDKLSVTSLDASRFLEGRFQYGVAEEQLWWQ
jgi:hypothetical protein